MKRVSSPRTDARVDLPAATRSEVRESDEDGAKKGPWASERQGARGATDVAPGPARGSQRAGRGEGDPSVASGSLPSAPASQGRRGPGRARARCRHRRCARVLVGAAGEGRRPGGRACVAVGVGPGVGWGAAGGGVGVARVLFFLFFFCGGLFEKFTGSLSVFGTMDGSTPPQKKPPLKILLGPLSGAERYDCPQTSARHREHYSRTKKGEKKKESEEKKKGETTHTLVLQPRQSGSAE